MLRRLALANPAKNTGPNVRYSYSIGYEGCDAETCQKNKIMRLCNTENTEVGQIGRWTKDDRGRDAGKERAKAQRGRGREIACFRLKRCKISHSTGNTKGLTINIAF